LRIAVCGTHGVGKSTLTEDLGLRLPGHRIIEESYYILADRGYDFSEPPTIAEYQLMLRQSLAVMQTRRRNVIFDRCPLDYLAYMYALLGSGGLSLEPWQAAIENAISSLDLLVYIPITLEANAMLPSADYEELRILVDDRLREMIIEDQLGVCVDVEVMELVGPLRSRTDRVMDCVSRLTPPQ
jgi:hypothetical protein